MSSTYPSSIYIVGAQSTGKTTLVKALQNYFYGDQQQPSSTLTAVPQVITEVARTVLVEYGYTAHDITSSPSRALSLQKLILKAQVDAERAGLRLGTWIISDRSGVDPVVYAQKYVNEDAARDLAFSPEALELSERMKSSLVFVCEAGVDWLIDDGVRLMPGSFEEWIETHELFCHWLEELGLKYEVITRNLLDTNKRVEFVLEKWKSYQAK